MSRANTLLSIATASLLLAASTVAGASDVLRYADSPEDEPTEVSIAADLLVVRPLGLVATILGTTAFFLGLPFAAMAGDIATPGRVLVEEPAQFTFDRPLGRLRY